MSHCVYSYGPSIENGLVSIWSMRFDGERVATIEVRNATKSVVQYRGRFNKKPPDYADKVLARWASNNGISVRVFSQW